MYLLVFNFTIVFTSKYNIINDGISMVNNFTNLLSLGR